MAEIRGVGISLMLGRPGGGDGKGVVGKDEETKTEQVKKCVSPSAKWLVADAQNKCSFVYVCFIIVVHYLCID